MKGFIYFEYGVKWLLLCDENGELLGKYDLTKLGLEHIESPEEFLTLFPEEKK